ncbi:hypothetical protein TRFO_38803 [Tritrichomonas foetus]|uniref:Leucine Rich Repeat family protein n=1 Tax=Tritrichomonas foetus TaxID=1144522 RepID=A0A1J4JCI9_9EUKA|nr:hypothetical protein TRFO_38803 [Tritrichomonas foetus]|eukprot:OHS94988.1 hypothetical protein TRFO_38803 [Tritrichomonas foetus]
MNKMNEFKPIIMLASKVFEKFTNEFLWGPQETVYFASEVTKMHLNGGTDSRILIISVGSIYVFRARSFSKNELAARFNLVDVQKLSYIEPNIVTWVIKDPNAKSAQLTLQTDHALYIARLILHLNRICNYSFSDDIKVESSPPNALVIPRISTRPPSALQTRIIQIAHKLDQRFPLEMLKQIADWDNRPQATLRLTSTFNCGAAANSIAWGIGMDPDVKCLILDSFAPAQLQNVLQILFEHSKSLLRLSLDNYKDPPSENFNLPAPLTTKIFELAFKNCHAGIIFSVLNGMNNFSGRIKILTISRTKLSGENFRYLFDLLNRLPCFMGLNNLKFEEGAADNLVIDDLPRFLPMIKVSSFSIMKTTQDIATLVSSIFPFTSSISMLYLTMSKLCERVKNDLALPDCLTYLDISRSQVIKASFSLFLKTILTKERENLITFNFSDLAYPTNSTEPLVSCFSNIENAQSIIGEFIFAGNSLLPEQTATLLTFLRSQKSLLYLNLSRCFKERIDESLKLLADFVIDTKLEGLELSSAPNAPLKEHMTTFLKLLIGKAKLRTLVIDKSGMSDNGLLILKQYVEADTKLTSLNCDGASPTSLETFKQAYSAFTKVDRVQFPKADIMKLGGKVQMPPGLSSKLPLLNLAARITEYQNKGAGSSTNDTSPMDALVDFMGQMTNAITGKSPIQSNNDEIVEIFKKSITTSTVHIKQEDDSQSDPLMALLNLSGASNDANSNL